MSLKVIRIEPNNKCYIVEWKPGDKLNGQRMDHENLMGLVHKGLRMGMFALEWTQPTPPPPEMMNGWDDEAKSNYNSYEINNIAMKILKYVKYPERYIDYPGLIKGPVLLYHDDNNMTKEKWNIIRKFIKSKNKQ